MAVKIEDILQINLVLVGLSLLNTAQETSNFRRAVGTEVLTTEAGIGNEVVNRTHTLSRDRITIAGSPDRTSVIREFPRPDELDRLAYVAAMALENTDLSAHELIAFGYNLEIVYEGTPPEQAISYLGKRLFRSDVLQNGQTNLAGGSAKLFFVKDNRYWQVALEPRLNDQSTTRIFAGVNLHRPEQDVSLLTESEIKTSLELVWSEAHDLVNRIDGSDK
jgi:hypothetical protein